MWRDDAEAVRSEDPHAEATGGRDQFPLGGGTLRAYLLEPCGEDDDRAAAGLRRRDATLNIRRLGWSEVGLTTAFVLLLIAAF